MLELEDTSPDLFSVVRRSNWSGTAGEREDSRHRLKIIHLLREVPAGGTLTVLGAGTARSLDLALLLGRFSRIFLVDLDRGAVSEVARAAALAGLVGVTTLAPVDLSGMLSKLPEWRYRPPEDAELEAWIDDAQRSLRCRMPESDVVLSDCWLKESAALLELGIGRAAWLPRARRALLRGHLSSLLQWPGCAHAVLLSEACTAPRGEAASGVPSLKLLAEWSKKGQLIDVGDPFAAAHEVCALKSLAPTLQLRLIDPWRWVRNPSEGYFVSGLRLSFDEKQR